MPRATWSGATRLSIVVFALVLGLRNLAGICLEMIFPDYSLSLTKPLIADLRR
jgi:hypothetical protein